MFSFNSPFGACPDCKGLGFLQKIDPELIIDPEKSVIDGALGKVFASMEYKGFYRQEVDLEVALENTDFAMSKLMRDRYARQTGL